MERIASGEGSNGEVTRRSPVYRPQQQQVRDGFSDGLLTTLKRSGDILLRRQGEDDRGSLVHAWDAAMTIVPLHLLVQACRTEFEPITELVDLVQDFLG
jgi:hypothetical protein